MAYADLLTIQTLNVGDILTAACMTQVRNNEEFLIDPPACSVYNNTTQSVATSTAVALNANAEYFDNDSMHSTSSSTSRITVQTVGRYLFFATASFAADVDGVRQIDFRVNGATVYESMQVPAVSAISSIIVSGVKAIPLTTGDYVEVRALHNAGSNLAVSLFEFGATYLTR